ncbi:hypothetical protein OG978_46065 (plasmid) [Streptomyces sp. NBC_01591]|uniref:hypothetical protein n=1 Tax=Streptomyces sp. NBC_01591 TaxID=2975888 RepID=UPI002DD86B97|nr:hypothetical protein [Streptomyces sp. NBC_01591]WSD74409.1 hypothetical protein OG978_46065 [Streptomyces sp. NBC_01591]
MIMLVVVGVLLIMVSRMGQSSGGFLATGIAAVVLGVALLVVTIVGGRRPQRP